MKFDTSELGYLELCDEQLPRVRVIVRASVSTEGELRVDGHDIGNAVEEIFGDSDYEYFYTLDAHNTEKLFEVITKDKSNLKEAFLENFSGVDGCKHLREICEENNIKYSLFTY